MSALSAWCPGCEANPDWDGYLAYCPRHRPSVAGLDDAAVRERVPTDAPVLAESAVCRAFSALIHRPPKEASDDCDR